MSGFAPEWLSLREAADHRAVNHAVRRELHGYLAGFTDLSIADLGCGTGSNFRSLAPEIDRPQGWLLVDHDPKLLALAKVMTADLVAAKHVAIDFKQADLSSGDLSALLGSANLITAAALFDLVSPPVINKMVDGIVAANCAFYTVLTYDGVASWLPEQPANTVMRDAFNRHQQTDKGFGPAAGPTATDVLAKAFEARGYRVVRGKSPWVLDKTLVTLRREADRGWAGAVVETGALTQEEADAWLHSRDQDIDVVTLVGHEDLFAMPRD